MTKKRIDVLLVERGLIESRTLAKRVVMAGQVRADGTPIVKPSIKVDIEAKLEIIQGPQFVSRGGQKLAKALDVFDISIAQKICADVGASTGGFTDCLLQHGAEKVYAIDVGYGILHWKLRNDPRVVVMERTNARYLEWLPEKVDLVTIDASFISLKLLLPVIRDWFRDERGDAIILIKPQYEAGRLEVSRGKGVIRVPEIHKNILLDLLGFSEDLGLKVRNLIRSPLLGPKGNVEFLAWLTYPHYGGKRAFVDMVNTVVNRRLEE